MSLSYEHQENTSFLHRRCLKNSFSTISSWTPTFSHHSSPLLKHPMASYCPQDKIINSQDCIIQPLFASTASHCATLSLIHHIPTTPFSALRTHHYFWSLRFLRYCSHPLFQFPSHFHPAISYYALEFNLNVISRKHSLIPQTKLCPSIVPVETCIIPS